MNIGKGFSLLELMTVVVVTAILTAAAIPTYRHFLRDARLASAREYVNSFNGQIRNYYIDNGIVPTNAQLGITSSVPANASEYFYQPYLAYMLVAPVATTASQCQYGTSTAYFSNYQGDFYADGVSKYVVLTNYYIDNNGVMNNLCSYYEYDPVAGSATGAEIFADCVNTDNPGSSSIMTLINTECS